MERKGEFVMSVETMISFLNTCSPGTVGISGGSTMCSCVKGSKDFQSNHCEAWRMAGDTGTIEDESGDLHSFVSGMGKGGTVFISV